MQSQLLLFSNMAIASICRGCWWPLLVFTTYSRVCAHASGDPEFVERPKSFQQPFPRRSGFQRTSSRHMPHSGLPAAVYEAREAGHKFEYSIASIVDEEVGHVFSIDEDPNVAAVACESMGAADVNRDGRLWLRWNQLPVREPRPKDLVAAGSEWQCGGGIGGEDGFLVSVIDVISAATTDSPTTVLLVRNSSAFHIFRELELEMSWTPVGNEGVSSKEVATAEVEGLEKLRRLPELHQSGELPTYSYNYNPDTGKAEKEIDTPYMTCSDCYGMVDGTWTVSFHTNGLNMDKVSYRLHNASPTWNIVITPKVPGGIDSALENSGWQTVMTAGGQDVLNPLMDLVTGIGLPLFSTLNGNTLQLKVVPDIALQFNFDGVKDLFEGSDDESLDVRITSPPEDTYFEVTWTPTGGYQTSFNIDPKVTTSYNGMSSDISLALGVRLLLKVSFWALGQNMTSLEVSPEATVSAKYSPSVGVPIPQPTRNALDGYLCVQFLAFNADEFWMIRQGNQVTEGANEVFGKMCFAGSCISSRVGTWTTTGFECNCTGGCSKGSSTQPWCYVNSACSVRKKGQLKPWAVCEPNKVVFWRGQQCMRIQQSMLADNPLYFRAMEKSKLLFDTAFAQPGSFLLQPNSNCRTPTGCQMTQSLPLLPEGTGVYRKRPASLSLDVHVAVYPDGALPASAQVVAPTALVCDGLSVTLQMGCLSSFGGFEYPKSLSSQVPQGMWVDPVISPLIAPKSGSVMCLPASSMSVTSAISKTQSWANMGAVGTMYQMAVDLNSSGANPPPTTTAAPAEDTTSQVPWQYLAGVVGALLICCVISAALGSCFLQGSASPKSKKRTRGLPKQAMEQESSTQEIAAAMVPAASHAQPLQVTAPVLVSPGTTASAVRSVNPVLVQAAPMYAPVAPAAAPPGAFVSMPAVPYMGPPMAPPRGSYDYRSLVVHSQPGR